MLNRFVAFFSGIKIKTKMRFLILIPLCSIIFLSYWITSEYYKDEKSADLLQESVILSVQLSAVVHELQKERGASSGFLGSKGGESFKNILTKQRVDTQKSMESLENFLKKFDISLHPRLQSSLQESLTQLAKISEIRQNVDSLNVNINQILGYYTSTIAKIIDTISQVANESTNNQITKDLVAYINFLLSKENAGQERAVLSNTFGANQFAPGIYNRFLALVVAQNAYLSNFRDYVQKDILDMYDKKSQDNSFAEVERMRKIAMDRFLEGNFGVEGTYWFTTITNKINILKEVEDHIAENLLQSVRDMYAQSKFAFQLFGLLAVLVVLFIFVLGVGTVREITGKIDRIESQLLNIAERKDLNQQISIYSSDEMGNVAKAVNVLLESFKKVLANVQLGSRQNSNISSDMFKIAEEALSVTKQGKTLSEQLAILEHDMKDSVLMNNKMAQDTKQRTLEASENLAGIIQLVNQLSEMVEVNASVQESVLTNVKQLESDAMNIKGVLTVIADIADQTNLLALNAAIEAARAGEHGRGFAVVSDEVRSLAERTQKSLNEVNIIINTISQAITGVSSQIADSSESFFNLVSVARDMTSHAHNIADSMNEVTGMSDCALQSSQKLQAHSQSFLEGNQQITDCLQNIVKEMEKIFDISQELDQKTLEIQQQLAEFHISQKEV
ncbi:hypothetical protein CCZ01_00610 [Helicobacter monodelphidis]|uniref:methyl-accepting chemotaxis protein n=1 Tax=Helicobacter sp. 15-1451 TaxID=2004995 RepID=UPI000DCB00CC|nr:methyl-accepting chemotaxis protein [Helicobacter sp. 15-1451]RAX59273.1 hypothetical protein CCZ01_00610 [Helicobacter sp. 15-1451]